MSWKVEQRASFSLSPSLSSVLSACCSETLKAAAAAHFSSVFWCVLFTSLWGAAIDQKPKSSASVVPDHEKMKTKSDCWPTPLQARWGRSTGLLVYCVGSFFIYNCRGHKWIEPSSYIFEVNIFPPLQRLQGAVLMKISGQTEWSTAERSPAACKT